MIYLGLHTFTRLPAKPMKPTPSLLSLNAIFAQVYQCTNFILDNDMNAIKPCTLAILAASLLMSSSLAMADRGHRHGGSSIGVYVGGGFGPGFGSGFGPYYPRPYYGPVYGPSFYGEPYYYGYPQPPVIIAPAPQPQVYIEQAPQPVQVQPAQIQTIPAAAPQATSAPAQDYYWYHCDKPDGYYPYVKECPQGWQKVTPEPPK